MAAPEFWSSELALYSQIGVDDGDYRWVLRGHEWIPAKTSPGKLAGQFVATAVDGTKFDCQSIHIAENIPSVAELKRFPDDLIHLDDMSEKSVVFALTQRFANDNIYTSIGDILIAINPFRPLPLYTPSVMQQYLSPYSQNLPPHPFEISRRAYQSMLRNHQDQAILISGESGAGKTESTKLCLSFFTEAAGSATGIEQKILSANPILEAFGNAKTLRNNNSSRFGKFMNLSFECQGGMIVGCGTTNYLLEKSRVHKQAAGERSYHIFYQICSAVADYNNNNQENSFNSSNTRESLRRKTLYDEDSPSRRSQRGDLAALALTGNPEDYHYLLQSGCITIPNVSDFDQFCAMETACIKLGLQKFEINDIYSVCSAILHLGNIQFRDKSNTTTGGCEVESLKACTEALNNASKLMGLTSEEISLRLRTRELLLRGEVNSIQNTAKQAVEARDALCKMLYKRCFDWLIERTNLAMIDNQTEADHQSESSGTRNGALQRRHIGILDIFGFEIFDVNGFEQFCINYANEKLQQHFNQHTFKSEIEACQRENISLEGFSFTDNQHVLDLIEAKSAVSILSILDDECRVPKSTGVTFLNKLKDKHSKNPIFSVAKGEASKDSFGIDHYAGRVIYKVHEFLEKNKDYLGDDLEGLLKRSYLSFEPPKTIEQLRQEEEEQLALGTGKAKPKQLTLGSKFRLQLDDLINMLNSSQPHFIRCVKPNDNKLCNFFHGVCVHQQLKQSGAFDALAIRKRGYNYQFKHEVFMSRYGPILRERYKNGEISQEFIETLSQHQHLNETETKKLCEEMIKLVATLPNMEQIALNIQVGSTMVFWRATEEKQLSNLRSKEIHNQIILIQKRVRGGIVRKYINNWLSIIKNEIMKEYHRINQKRKPIQGSHKASEKKVQDVPAEDVRDGTEGTEGTEGKDVEEETIESLEKDIAILKELIDKLYTIPLKLTHYLNQIKSLIKFLESRKKLLMELQKLKPNPLTGENITRAWIQCHRNILNEKITNCSLVSESMRIYDEFIGSEEGLEYYFKVLDTISYYDLISDDFQHPSQADEDPVTLSSIQEMITTIQQFQQITPKYCINELKVLNEMMFTLEAENTLMNELVELYGQIPITNTLPRDDYIAKILTFSGNGQKVKLGRQVKAALRLADYMLELRKQMLELLKISESLDLVTSTSRVNSDQAVDRGEGTIPNENHALDSSSSSSSSSSSRPAPPPPPPPPLKNRASVAPRISQIYIPGSLDSRKSISISQDNPMHRMTKRASQIQRRSSVQNKIDVLTKEMKRMNSNTASSTTSGVGSQFYKLPSNFQDVLDDSWLLPITNYLKDYQPLREYILRVTNITPVVSFCDLEIESYESCLERVKAILKKTQLILKHACNDVGLCQNTLHLIEDFNETAPTSLPYLLHSDTATPDHLYELHLDQFSSNYELLNLSNKKLFQNYQNLITTKLLKLQNEEKSVEELLRTLESTCPTRKNNTQDPTQHSGSSSSTSLSTNEQDFELPSFDFHGIEELNAAIHRLKSVHGTNENELNSANGHNTTGALGGYYFSKTQPIIHMTELIRDLRLTFLSLQRDSITTADSNTPTEVEEEKWNDIRHSLTQLSPYSEYYSTSLQAEIDLLRTIIYHHDHTKQERERLSDFQHSLEMALRDEDEGQINFILKQFETIPVLKTFLDSIADREDYTTLIQQLKLSQQQQTQQESLSNTSLATTTSTTTPLSLQQLEQNLCLLICQGKELCYKFLKIRELFHSYEALQEYRLQDLQSLMTEISSYQLNSSPLFATHQTIQQKLLELLDLKERVHRAWYSDYLNIDNMIALSKEANNLNFFDDEVTYLDYLLSKYHQDYSNYLMELIKLNEFLNRHEVVTELNLLLNDFYLSNKSTPNGEEGEGDERNDYGYGNGNGNGNVHDEEDSLPSPPCPSLSPSLKDEENESVAELTQTIQPKLTIRPKQSGRNSPPSPSARSSSGVSSRSSDASSSRATNFINRASHDTFDSTNKKKPGYTVAGLATGANASHVLSSLSVKDRIKQQEHQEEKRRLKEQNDYLQQQKVKAIAAIIPSVQVQVRTASEVDEEVDITASDQEGDLYVWHRYKGLRRFADPVLEQARKIYSNQPIPISLTRINNDNYIQLSVTAFKCLQGVMGDRVALYPSMLKNEFFTIAKTNIILADELYCQIMKQLTTNPSKISREKGIEVFQSLVEIILPSQALKPYIEYFLREYNEVNLLLYLQSKFTKNNTSLLSNEMNDPLGRHQDQVSTSNHSGYLIEVKGKLIQIHLKRWCILDEDSFSVYLCDDTTNRVAGYLMSQIKEIRSKSSQDNFTKQKFPFEMELKSGHIKIFIADSIDSRARWIHAFKSAKFGSWNSKTAAMGGGGFN